MDQQVKIRGHRIELEEVEGAILATLPVAETAVIRTGTNRATPCLLPMWCQRIKRSLKNGQSFLKFSPNGGKSLKTRLPDVLYSLVFIPLDVLPLTHNGKVNRRALPAPNEWMKREYVLPAPLQKPGWRNCGSSCSCERCRANDHFRARWPFAQGDDAGCACT